MLTLVSSRPILTYFCLPPSVLNPHLETGVRVFQVWILFYPVAWRLLEAESRTSFLLSITNHAGSPAPLLLFLVLAHKRCLFPNLDPIFPLIALTFCVGISWHHSAITECLSDSALCQGHQLSKHFRSARQAGQTASGGRKKKKTHTGRCCQHSGKMSSLL